MKTVLIKPLITEKIIESGGYAFVVNEDCSKKEIVKAIKNAFSVDVVSIKTVIVKGKSKKSWKTRKVTKAANWKKAVIKIKDGQKIDLFEAGGGKEEKK